MYVTQAQLETGIPAAHLVDGCDDDSDGVADTGVLEAVIETACNQVDAFLGGRYETPFNDPAPAPVREAAFVFAAELVYSRRQVDEANPFKARAELWRERLADIAAGTESLQFSELPPKPGALVTEAAKVDGTML